MITSLDITGITYTVSPSLKRYIEKKIGRLDRYLPRHARKTVTADVKLREVNRDHGNKYEAEVILTVPDKTLTAKDTTVNMFAAIDIVEQKAVAQLKKYKQSMLPHVANRRILGRTKRRTPQLDI